jgi:glyceraldehyde 3-phosphate dehydrogenase
MAEVRLGINGFGRIGRQVTRIAARDPRVEVVAVNDLVDPRTNAHLFKYDTTYGRFDGTTELDGDDIVINGTRVRVFKQKDPAQIPWGDSGVDYVLESTGVFTNVEDCGKHLEAGAKLVMLSAPAKGEMPTYVMGVNEQQWLADGRPEVVSNASCTTNCLAPLVKVLNDSFGIVQGYMNTVHSYTNDQRILDKDHKDLRRARAAAENIIPTTTGAAKAVALVIPELKGKLDGFALRVPTPTGSVVDFTAILGREVTANEVNSAFEAAANGALKGIMAVTHDPIVSSDIIADPHSCIIDAALTSAMGSFVKTIGWYDNEWGYSCRCVDMLRYFAEHAEQSGSVRAS